MAISEHDFNSLLIYAARENSLNKSLETYKNISPQRHEEHKKTVDLLRAINTKKLIRNTKRIV